MNKTKLKIKVTPADATKASGYFDHENCLLATAIRRSVPELYSLSVLGTFLYINGNRYNIDERGRGRVAEAYPGEDRDQKPIVNRAFTVTLTPD